MISKAEISRRNDDDEDYLAGIRADIQEAWKGIRTLH